MSSLPSVSVIIPNYNHEDFLEQRIESVLNQTYSHFEVIILDDNSSDKSLEILIKYNKHPLVKTVIANKENSGSVFRQWVKGINLATGKYLWIAESDDFAHEEFLEETVKLAEENENAGLIFTDSYKVNETGEINEKISIRHPYLENITGNVYMFDQKDNAPLYFIQDMLIQNVSAVLFKVENLITCVDFTMLQTLKNTGDRFSYFALFLKSPIVYLNKPLNYMRLHGENETSKNSLSGVIYQDRIRVINYFLEHISNFSTSKIAMRNFLKKNYLQAVDFFYFNEVSLLLNKLINFKLISFKKFFFLSGYNCFAKIYWNTPPLFLRKKVKNILKK